MFLSFLIFQWCTHHQLHGTLTPTHQDAKKIKNQRSKMKMKFFYVVFDPINYLQESMTPRKRKVEDKNNAKLKQSKLKS